MTLLILPRGAQPRLSRPSGPFVFNKDSPQAEGLVFWAPMYTPGKLIDFTQRNQPTVTLGAAGEWNIHPVLGRYVLDLTGADNHFICPTNGFRSDQGTIMAWWEIANIDNHRWMYSEQGTANNNNEVEFLYLKSNNRIEFAVWDGILKSTALTDTGTVETGVMIHWAGTWNNQSIRLYKNGVFKDAGSGSTPNAMATTAFWGSRTALDFRADMKFGDCRVYDWKIPASLVAQAHAPQTRDDLVYELGRTLYFFSAPSPAGDSRISQLGAEIAVQPDERRITQVGAEVAVQPDERRISQVGVEVAVLTSEVGWVPFAFTPSMRVIGSALRGATDFVDASLDSRGIPLDELLLDCPTGEVGKDKVVEDSIAPGAVSEAHSFNDAASVALNQNDGALVQTHALALSPAVTREVQIFFTFIASTTNVQGDHMLVQAEIKEDAVVLINKSVVLTIAKGNIDHLGTVSFRAMVPAGGAEYTVHMNINDNSTAPTIKNRTMFARDFKA